MEVRMVIPGVLAIPEVGPIRVQIAILRSGEENS